MVVFDLVTWALVAVAAGFVGYIGKYLCKVLIARCEKNKCAADGSGTTPKEESWEAGFDYDSEKKKLKLEKKRLKVEKKRRELSKDD